ncbi:unnamed protein product [Heligmosomoides polygyrus]|uniref:HTH_48 domain-containing protein n=1 Tax=Heligmosomoides polygyrus TaxID=6339 RepID=A0A3P8GGE9_HELPZ|nr:unnamed protein product [Heligmosomoides polygyrus]
MDKRVIRGIYLYEFKLGTTAKEADEKINAAFGQGCSTIRTAYRWYQKFRNGDESLEEHEGREKHSDVDEDKLRDVVEEDPHKDDFWAAHHSVAKEFTSLMHCIRSAQ